MDCLRKSASGRKVQHDGKGRTGWRNINKNWHRKVHTHKNFIINKKKLFQGRFEGDFYHFFKQ